MLRRLLIQNYLLVREVELGFNRGLTVITGETGVGKSMIVGGLEVLLGARFPKDAVAAGAERAVIEGEFEFEKRREMDGILPMDEGDDGMTVILRREFSAAGRTRSWINDHPAGLDDIIRLRQRLADFHGQREHQSLFDPRRQIEYLDLYAGTVAQAASVRDLYTRRHECTRHLTVVRANLAAFRKEQALLSYQLDEIERLGLKAGEEEEIEARLRKLESIKKLTEESARLLDVISESNPSLVSLGGMAKQISAGLAKTDHEIDSIANELAILASQIKDLAQQVRHYHDSLSLDETELLRLRDRRSMIWELRRKHGMTVEQVLSRIEGMKSALAEGERLENEAKNLEDELARTSQRLVGEAGELSAARGRAAQSFADDVIAQLRPIGFTSPQFIVQIESLAKPYDSDLITEDGADVIGFLFTANPGIAAAPIHDVASGGESSRVTLAIKSVLSEKADYPVMVYDEIDIGISGRVADQVGTALNKLARNHQVIVITHLPQIASRADHHLVVEKRVKSGKTETSARFLNNDERIPAIASLLTGAKITEKALATASELLRNTSRN